MTLNDLSEAGGRRLCRRIASVRSTRLGLSLSNRPSTSRPPASVSLRILSPLSRWYLPAALRNARALLLAQPNDKQHRGAASFIG